MASKVARRPVRQARQARAQATVEAIIQAAAQILAEAGWGALNTNLVARRAGVSVGSVYEYFPNKNAIVDAILDAHLRQGEALIAQGALRLVDRPDISEIVSLLVGGFISLHRDDPRLHRVLSSETPLSPEQRSRVERLRLAIIQMVAEALAPHVETPELRASLIVDVAESLSHRWLVDEAGTPASEAVMAAELHHMLEAYLRACPAP
ncbi:MAG: TetR/AcrR family transcriptional regulator [Phenylobacterium sp.]|nr:TetR/AcrR family transcriptional regulator [Phenylobacterium sp.]